mgnify:CR=1 FL=1
MGLVTKYKTFLVISILLLLIIGIIIIVHRKKKNKENEPVLLDHAIDIRPLVIRCKCPSPNGIQFAYSFWIFMDNISGSENWKQNYYTDRNIIKKGNTPSLYYDPETNVYKIGVLTKMTKEKVEVFEVDNVDLQRWNHWIISFHNRNVDLFINGHLIHSFVTTNVPILTNDPIIIGSTKAKVNGKISYIRYFNSSIDKAKARKLYEENKHDNVPHPSPFLGLFS